MPALLGIVAVTVVTVLWQMLRHAVPRRLALRALVRRPGETALVIAGSLLGTAIITGSFIVGDTLDSSIRATAYTKLGPVDEVVVVDDAGAAKRIESALEDVRDDRIDGVLRLTAARASIAAGDSGRVRAEPGAQVVEVPFERARAFGGDPESTGIVGVTPRPGRAVITDDLASALDAGPGDEVSAFAFGTRLRLRVTRVLPAAGVAGFWLGFETRSPNAFVAPGTIEGAARAGLAGGAAPPAHVVAVSNRGGVEDGAALTTPVTRLIREVLGSSLVRVDTVKRDVLDSAATQGDQFRELFVGIGSFALVAGILLLINVFVMLADERKAQLGMLRAVGMRRRDLVRSFVFEGLFYAVVAAAAGALGGVGLGWAIVRFAAPIFGGFGDFSLDLIFAMDKRSIVVGFCAGLLISLATVTLTSVRISRLNIIRAIRDLPEPKSRHGGRRALVGGAALTAFGVALSVSSIAAGGRGWAGAIVGPPLAAAGLLPLTGRLVARRTALGALGFAALVWGVFGNALTGGVFFEAGEIFAFVLQGLLLNIAAVLLLGQTQENVEAWLRRAAPRSLSLRLGLAYPLARRFRTGLTLGMFSLVMFTMVFIAVLADIFGGQVDRVTRDEAGGFDVFAQATASNPPSVSAVSSAPGVRDAAGMRHGEALFEVPALPSPEPWAVSGIDRAFVEVGPPRLEDRASRFDTDREAWSALLSTPRYAIVPNLFLQEGGGPPRRIVKPGGTMLFVDPATGRSVELEVVGVTASDFAFSGVYMSAGSVARVLGDRAPVARFYLSAPGDAEAVARRLQGRFVRNGVEAETFASRVAQFQRENVQFLRLMQGYLALGLVVGIAGLGVVMVRAVRERRRDIGVLRSLGFLAPMVRRAFVLESGFTALEGIAVGSFLALVTASQLIATGEFGRGVVFGIPWTDVTTLCASSLAAALAATAWPARQASRTPPAVALRIAE